MNQSNKPEQEDSTETKERLETDAKTRPDKEHVQPSGDKNQTESSPAKHNGSKTTKTRRLLRKKSKNKKKSRHQEAYQHFQALVEDPASSPEELRRLGLHYLAQSDLPFAWRIHTHVALASDYQPTGQRMEHLERAIMLFNAAKPLQEGQVDWVPESHMWTMEAMCEDMDALEVEIQTAKEKYEKDLVQG